MNCDAHQLIEQHLVHSGMRCLFALAGDLGETGGAGLADLHDLIRSTCTSGYDWTSYFIILFPCALLLFGIHATFRFVFVLHLFIHAFSIPPFVILMFMGITF